MFLQLKEDDRFYFDAVAGDRSIRFIEKYLCHYEDAFAGKPFLLMDWQKQIASDIFGWKRRADGLRRFRELFLLLSKGQGKTPFITALSLFLFFGEKRLGQQFFSVATDFRQANLTFDSAKKMIRASPKLDAKVRIKQYEIAYTERNSSWQIISGTADGKAGFRPDCIAADEVWEWSGRKLYDNIEANLFKRQEPMMLLATNVGLDQTGVWHDLYKRAERCFAGQSSDDRFYPVVFQAKKDAALDDEQAWRDANPSLGTTIRIEDLRHKAAKAKESPPEESKFRRLHLSQFVQGSSKWIDMPQWDTATAPIKTNLESLPLYLGLDLSFSDDLSSLAAVWVGKKRFYVRIWTWVPRGSAEKYEKRDDLPFSRWAEQGHIRLLESRTVDDLAQRRIAKLIVKLKSRHKKFVNLGYDKWRASAVVAQCERAGVACVAVRPDYEGMSAGCHELTRRLKDRSIVLPENAALRWQAANVEVVVDRMGNIRPVKEDAGGTYGGRRGSKIDAIVSLVIAISQAKRHEFRDDAGDAGSWNGEIEFV